MNIRPKSPEVLRRQVEAMSKKIGEPITPPNETWKNLLNLKTDQLSTRYPQRYRTYLRLQRASQRGEEISPEAKRHIVLWLKLLNGLDAYIAKHHAQEDERTLHEHQISIFEAFRDWLEKGAWTKDGEIVPPEGYFKLPTGYGKTVLFSEMIEATGLRTLVVVPNLTLVEQTKEKFDIFAKELDVGEIHAGIKRYGTDVTVITYQSLISQLQRYKIDPKDKSVIHPEQFDCLILDEAHRSLSEVRRESIQKFPHAIKLGFTATPKFSENKQLAHLLNNEIYSVSIRQAVEEFGALCSFSVMLVQTNIDIGKIPVSNAGEYNEKELAKAVNLKTRNLAAVNMHKQAFADQKAIAYCVGVEHAKQVAMDFQEAGFAAACIHGGMSKKEQEDILEKFHRRELMILTNADILIEGFDDQEVSVAYNLRPTFSQVVAEQRGGRVLRIDPATPGKHARIVEFIDKNEDGEPTTITFAEIADGVEMVKGSTRSSDKREGGRGGDGKSLPDIHLDGMDVIYDEDEVLRVMKEMKDAALGPPPEGWVDSVALAERLGVDRTTIARKAEKIPEELRKTEQKKCLTAQHSVAAFYSPKLIDWFEKKLLRKNIVPKDWMTFAAFAQQILTDPDSPLNATKPNGTPPINISSLQRGLTSIVRFIPESKKQMADYYDKRAKRTAPCWGPEQMHLVRALAMIRPAGWYSILDLAKEAKRSLFNTQQLFQDYLSHSPGEFGWYLSSSTGQYEEYCSHEVAELILEKLVLEEQTELDWMPFSAFHRAFGLKQPNVKKCLEKLKPGPEDVKYMKNSTGNLVPYLSPVIMRRVLEMLRPESLHWPNLERVAEEIGVDQETVLIALMYVQVGQRDTQKQIGANGETEDRFSLALVAKLKKYLEAQAVA